MSRSGQGIWKTGALTLTVAASGAAVSAPPSYASAPVANDRLGVNFEETPAHLSGASTAGTGVARSQVIEGSNIDAVVTLTASAHLRLYPMLGLPASHGAPADAAEMASFVVSFEQRYGPHGSFWQANPQLPYLPVETYEIGNEPDITPTHPQDEVSLHYSSPADYALVYETARAALHGADPNAKAVVGGMLDSDSIGLADAERYLSAIGPMDAVGFHPYLYQSVAMEEDTMALRDWLDSNGHRGVPIDINEFGAFSGTGGGIQAWGQQVAQYTEWALCNPSLGVENVQPEWWGDTSGTATDPWYAVLDADGNQTPLGTAYLDEVKALTTQGCPSTAAVQDKASSGTEQKSSRFGVTAQAAAAKQAPKPAHRTRKARRRKHRHKH